MGVLGVTDTGVSRVDINTVNTTLNVSLTSGTTSGVDVLVNGYRFDVEISTEINGPNVHFIPLISSNISQYEQVPNPWEVGVTMKNITGSFSLIPELLLGITNTRVISSAGFAFNAFWHLNHGDSLVYKFSLVGEAIHSVGFGITPSTAYSNMALVDQDTAYIVYYEGNDETMVLSKLDFCNDSETIVHTHPVFFNGGIDLIYGSYFCTYVEYNDIQYVVTAYYTTSAISDYYTEKLFFVVYNITENTVWQSAYLLPNDTYDLQLTSGFITTPKIIDGKLIVTVWPTDWAGVIPSPLPDICEFPTFIVDCENSTVVRVDDFTAPSSIWPVALWGSGIDYDNNYYYFFLEDYTAIGGDGALMRIDLDTNTTSLITTNATNIYILQGDTMCYGLDGSADAKPIVTIPSLTPQGTLNDPYDTRVVDEKNGLIWSYNDSVAPRLEGDPFGGASEKNISISGWGSTPFTYPFSKSVTMYMIAGQIVLGVSSLRLSPTANQLDIYSCRRAIPCP